MVSPVRMFHGRLRRMVTDVLGKMFQTPKKSGLVYSTVQVFYFFVNLLPFGKYCTDISNFFSLNSLVLLAKLCQFLLPAFQDSVITLTDYHYENVLCLKYSFFNVHSVCIFPE